MDHNSPIILHCEHSRAFPSHSSRARVPGDITGPIVQDKVIAGVGIQQCHMVVLMSRSYARCYYVQSLAKREVHVVW